MPRSSSISTGSSSPEPVQPSEEKEWIVTNGLGGYASLTLLNTNTRKFHGLLVASMSPPTRRWVFVSNLLETIVIDGQRIPLGGHLRSFNLDPLPEFVYEIGDVTVRKRIWMPHRRNTTMLRYEIESDDAEPGLVFSPVLNSRHFYTLTGRGAVSFATEQERGCVAFRPSNQDIEIRIAMDQDRYVERGEWTELQFRVDRERREGWQEHAFIPGDLYPARGCNPLYVIMTIEQELGDPPTELRRELGRREDLIRDSGLPADLNNLVLASDSFIARRGSLETIVAGYHWFADWGRDALIALPGIALVPKRYTMASGILLNLAKHEREGLIPNAFMDETGEAIYNSVDAPLWFIDRVFQYVKYTGDFELVKMLWDRLDSIIEHYTHGTRFDIGMDEDRLISHGEGVTWMDVNIGGRFATPRARKAVEVQALWYNALRVMQLMAGHCGRTDSYGALADEVRESLRRLYDKQYDVIDSRDSTCRPNRLFLVSLDFSPLTKRAQAEIVSDVQERLLTPYGLRSLSNDSPGYYGRLIGDYDKDLAYHNGTVWPWLLGPFTTAFLKVKEHRKKWREYARQHLLGGIIDSIRSQGCIGCVSEVFDGDPPHLPRGCVSQAWSTAEVLRALVEDVYLLRPEFEERLMQNARTRA